MSSRTIEVDVIDGRIQAAGSSVIPNNGHGFLTIVESLPAAAAPGKPSSLREFISAPDFAITDEQFRASMESDFWEQ